MKLSKLVSSKGTRACRDMRFEKERERKGIVGEGGMRERKGGRRLERAVRERVTIAGFSERGRKQGGPPRCG